MAEIRGMGSYSLWFSPNPSCLLSFEVGRFLIRSTWSPHVVSEEKEKGTKIQSCIVSWTSSSSMGCTTIHGPSRRVA